MSIQRAIPDEDFPIVIDMDVVTAAATAKQKGYHLDIECHGAPYVWHGTATSQTAATNRAYADLAARHAVFNKYKARVVACVEV